MCMYIQYNNGWLPTNGVVGLLGQLPCAGPIHTYNPTPPPVVAKFAPTKSKKSNVRPGRNACSHSTRLVRTRIGTLRLTGSDITSESLPSAWKVITRSAIMR
jgi:hypothetical protein